MQSAHRAGSAISKIKEWKRRRAKARYAALQAELESDEVLLTAHHADDQLETILIALMRGAGLDGLAAMPSIARFAHAWHTRPLLDFTRNELQTWAQRQGISYITDPTNTQTQFDRNYLRLDVIPRFKQRWQSVTTTGARSASHLSEAQSLLNEYVAQDYLHAAADNTLSIKVLRDWSAARRRAVIRYWLQHNEVLMPSTRVLQALEHDMFNRRRRSCSVYTLGWLCSASPPTTPLSGEVLSTRAC